MGKNNKGITRPQANTVTGKPATNLSAAGSKSLATATPDPVVPVDTTTIITPDPVVPVDTTTIVTPNPVVPMDTTTIVTPDPVVPVDTTTIVTNDTDLVISDDKDVLDESEEYMQPYLSAYPDEIVFFVATDGQVFLSTAENDARNHQRKVDHTRELFEYFRG